MSHEQPNLKTVLVKRSNGSISEMLPTGERDDKGREIFQGIEMETFISPDPNDPTKTIETKGIPQKSISEQGLSEEMQSQLRIEFEAQKAERISPQQEELGEEALELSGIDNPSEEGFSPWSRETGEIPIVGTPTREAPHRFEMGDVVTTKKISVDGAEYTAVSTGWFLENGATIDIYAYRDAAGNTIETESPRQARSPKEAEKVRHDIEQRADAQHARLIAELDARPVYEADPLENAISGEELRKLREAAERTNGMSQNPAKPGMIEFPEQWKQK